MILAGFVIQEYFGLIYAQTTMSVEQIRNLNYTKLPNEPITLCRDQTLPASACFSELWQADIGIYVGTGIALIGLVVLFMPVARKLTAIVNR